MIISPVVVVVVGIHVNQLMTSLKDGESFRKALVGIRGIPHPKDGRTFLV